MKVLLISANTERISMVTMPLGLGIVPAPARRVGHEVTFLDMLAAQDPPSRSDASRIRVLTGSRGGGPLLRGFPAEPDGGHK